MQSVTRRQVQSIEIEKFNWTSCCVAVAFDQLLTGGWICLFVFANFCLSVQRSSVFVSELNCGLSTEVKAKACKAKLRKCEGGMNRGKVF